MRDAGLGEGVGVFGGGGWGGGAYVERMGAVGVIHYPGINNLRWHNFIH